MRENNLNHDNKVIEDMFPNLGWNLSYGLNYELQGNYSNPQLPFNCVGAAIHDFNRSYWPDEFNEWPQDIEKVPSIDNFLRFFKLYGYVECQIDERPLVGHDKIAIYCNHETEVTHVAYHTYHDDKFWKSKVGSRGEVKHRLFALCGVFKNTTENTFGHVCKMLKKQTPISIIHVAAPRSSVLLNLG